ncbi:hypothetical protein GCM10017668_22000 [Streptomyces tuirus]|uniref:Uncharacterized protein n=1 Tax=Streptomyces tuirus TaxID=68278 RepID=A0A7G1NF23_9ACTN|nr:hypothetical protein GCM10017668_22000 [Streptomyces tuirus]
MSQRTPAFCRLSSLVTVSSVVYATDAELMAPGSQATAPPTASTANVAATATRRPRGPSRYLVETPMEGSLPLTGAAR